MVAAQDTPWNGLRSSWITSDTTASLDSLTVIPYSIVIQTPRGIRLDSSYFQFKNNQLSWQRPFPTDSLLVRYRVLPFPLERPLSLLDSSAMQQTPTGILIGTYNPYQTSGGLLQTGDLNYSGSFSRGLSFGNRQDLVLNSSFNLQMAGEIGDGIQVTAAITDENLPIQPEGNTRQLRDFDRVFIRLERGQTQLTAGDYELPSPDGYFLQYFKKLEGATFRTQQEIGPGSWQSSASVAIARGQFRRQILSAIEGNQGPYKLQGASGERFIIVLAGTERVFLDGVLMQRGRDADYIIDYNQGEVTFMARRLITKDSRITVEFEYADQRYLRSLYAVNNQYQTDRWEAHINVYSQQDSRTSTGDLQITEEERQRLREAGDQLGGALISTIDSLDSPDSQRATYVLVDTLLNCNGEGVPATFLRYSTDADAAVYTASFSFVGSGQGSYVLDPDQAANERVYRWIPPDADSCEPQGDYEPVRQLAAPQLQRMLTAGGSYQLGTRGKIGAELAYSQEDLNRFSTLNSDDDQGIAARLQWQYRLPLQADSNGWHLNSTGQYEWLEANFRAINPFRSPEFLRDWNLANVNGIGSTEAAQEQLGRTGLQLQHPQWGHIGYQFAFFDREASYEGRRHQGDLQFQREGWRLTANSSWLNSSAPDQRTQFWRPQFQLSKTFSQLANWQLQLEAQAEKSQRQNAVASELNPSSFYFQRYVAQILSPQEEKYSFQASYRQRRDFRPKELEFVPSAQADEAAIQGSWQPSKSWRSSGTLTYRNLAVLDTSLTNLNAGQTLLGRIDLNANVWKGALRAATTYEIGSGQEPRIEYTYLFVGAGQGQYIWLDSLYNNDGKIQPNEMEIAPFPDIADHVRVSIFTDDFIRTDNVSLNQSFQLEPARAWRQSTVEWQKFLRRFDWQSSLTVNRKTRNFAGVQAWNPLQLNLPDSALVAVSSNQRHSLFFNRRSSNYDVQLEYRRLQSRLVPTTGFESRLQRTGSLRMRWNLTDATTLRMEGSLTERSADSEFFNNRDFDLRGGLLKPALDYQPGQTYRFRLQYQWQQESNRLPESMEAIVRQEWTIEGNYERWLRVSGSLINVQFTGDSRSPVAFALLNGLQPGRNYLWNASLTRQLGRYLQMTLSYEGRQTGEAPVVHVGRAQITAIF